MPTSLQQFLAVLYTDETFRARFLANPYEESIAAGFDGATALQLANMDRDGLEMAARSFARKRERKGAKR